VARPSHDSSWVAETKFSGVIAELALPRVTVRDLLPPELVLERGRGTARTYPLLTMFGEQTGSAVHVASMKVHTGVRFHEVLFGVRCVVRRSGEPVLFIPLMYCDEPVSRWSGSALYGFNKEAAEMEWLGDSFVVTAETTRSLVLRAGIEREPLGARHSSGPDVTSGVFLGRRQSGAYAWSVVEWGWKAASSRRMRVIVSIEDSIMPGIGPGTLYAGTDRALAVESLPWRIGWPQARHEGGQKRHREMLRVMEQAPHV
jgi:hypothetical protein